MLLSYNKGIINYDGFEKIEFGNLNVYYRGILWMRGKKAGKESVTHFIKKYIDSGKIPFIELFGAFSCIIEYSDGKLILFTDNSNMHCFFIGDKAIGSNFLEVAKTNKVNSFDIDSLCEFFSLGAVYFRKTLLKGIKLTDNDKVYIYDQGIIHIIEKGIGGIDKKSSISDVNEFFKEMAYALSELKVTLSLTGGYDSRMVFACLNNYIPVDTFISGDNEKDQDIIVSKRVAKAAGNKQEVIKTTKPNITEDYIYSLFDFSQGIIPFLTDGDMNIINFIINRANNGYNCYLSGDGGPMHKDWWWQQDLPFYNKKDTNVMKFYDQRIQYIKENYFCGKKLINANNLLKKRMLKGINKFVGATNTQSYDNFYYYLNGSKMVIHINTFSSKIPSYSPLWELELVRYSYNLPRYKRFFYNSMRDITTKANPAIAKIPTCYGTTASNEIPLIIRDILFQFIDYGKKMFRLFGRKLFNKSLFTGNVIKWSTEDDVRKLELTNRALDYCKQQEFIAEEANISNLSYPLLGRIVQIYMLSEYLDLNNHKHQ